jgi:hypothetical protein
MLAPNVGIRGIHAKGDKVTPNGARERVTVLPFHPLPVTSAFKLFPT